LTEIYLRDADVLTYCLEYNEVLLVLLTPISVVFTCVSVVFVCASVELDLMTVSLFPYFD